jgi:ornithine cyclodeaminase
VILLNDTAKIQKVLREADVVVTCTNTQTPLFDGAFLKPGCHINGIGSYTPKMQEVDEVSVRRSRILMDTLDATTVGDLKDVLSQHSVPGTILGQALKDKGVWLSQSVPSSVDCTFYKAVGTAIQDVLTAELVVDKALEQGIGIKLDMS